MSHETPKTVLVTGASRGIGAATALLLGEQGYDVAVHYASGKTEAEAVAAKIRALGRKSAAIAADMGSEAEVVRLFQEVDAALGPLGALVNNAALSGANAGGPVETLEWARAERVFAVNVLGLMTCCREALRRMKNNNHGAGGGAIVNVSSEAARFGGNRMSAYAASKAAVNTFTVGFAREAAEHGVRVNTVSPGVIDTEAHAGASEERMAGLKASIPMGRLGAPRDVAEAIAWLLSDKACYVSGTVLSVTGAR